MPRTTFAEIAVKAVENQPGRYARTLGQKAARLAELEGYGELSDRERTLVLELRLSIRRVVDAFRVLGRCKECGRELTDPTSVARGVGDDCWERVSADRKAQIMAWVDRQADASVTEPA